MKKFLLHPLVVLASLVLYVSTIGPFLISAPSTIAVLLGIGLGIGVTAQVYQFISARLPNLDNSQE